MNYKSSDYMKDSQKKRGPSEAKELPLQNILQSWFDNHEIAADFNEQDIINVWEELTGELIKKLTQKIYVKDKVLFVEVGSPALKQELMMIRNDLKNRLNSKLGKATVKSITIK
ncbi:MAG: DUF721 domain-containing protein [Bacteroidales bacterium]|nr:DUF721 domain-containing protein [Bacteroidales bacterium]